MNKALFLDRDGTLIDDRNYLSNPDEVTLLPGVVQALNKALSWGYDLFLFSNQSGVGRGWFTMEAVEACNRRMIELLALPEPGFTQICIAPEAPDQPQVYRKPSTRFIDEMVNQYALDRAHCFMVGDSLSDLEAGWRAKITSVLVKTERNLSAELRNFITQKRALAYPTLLAFVERLEKT